MTTIEVTVAKNGILVGFTVPAGTPMRPRIRRETLLKTIVRTPATTAPIAITTQNCNDSGRKLEA
ncbi:hypothetical protein GCM10010038_29800 [Glutamicibacter protophormiae]|nr:hypothetical protein GCM10010038_29800 [Glutamicibacter protophormiae]